MGRHPKPFTKAALTTSNRHFRYGPNNGLRKSALFGPDAPSFALGVQWHAQYDPQRNPINRALFRSFGAALVASQRGQNKG